MGDRLKASTGAHLNVFGSRSAPAESQKPASNKAKSLLRISAFE